MNAKHPSSTWGRRHILPHSITSRSSIARILALSILIVLTATSAKALTVFGINHANNNLVRFDSAMPATFISSIAITGMAGGEAIVGLDARPVDGKLYGLGTTSRLYIIDPITGAATQVGTGSFTTSINGTAFGFDFNPTVDRIRIVSDTNQNIRIDPNNGVTVTVDTPLAYAAGDANAGANPDIAGIAYTNNTASATQTTLYGIDTTLNILVTQGGLNGSPSPNGGQLFTVGSLGVDPTALLGFDIASNGVAFATMVTGGVPRLYTISLATGAATLVGSTSAATTVRAMTVAITSYSAAIAANTVTFTGSIGADSIVFDQSGGLLRHNRFSAGDSGFNSDFDFSSTVAGDQTVSATSPAVVVIVNAGDRDDHVVIGTNSAPASALAVTFQITGQGGGDSLVIDDSVSATGRTITVNGATSTVSGFGGPITYASVESVEVFAGTGADTINISGTAGPLTSVNAGGGTDTVSFASGATLSGGLLDGGGGTDTIDYSAYTTGVNVNLNETQTLFLSVLTGMQEPSPISTSQAAGRGVFVLNSAQTDLSFNIVYSGLTGAPISGTRFQNQAAGVNGPIVRDLSATEQNGLVTPSGSFTGVWSATDAMSLTAPSAVTPGSTVLQELLANRIYFNLNTLPNFPSGEIRGQLISQGLVGSATGTGGIRGFENATGGSGADTLTGNTSVNVLHGGGNNDTLIGGPSGDQLFGDDGADILVWNNGDGSDFMEGGTGNDTVQVNGSPTGGDQYLIQVNPADSSRLRFDRTNLGLFNLNIGTTEILDFNTLAGDDTTTVEFAGGNPIPSGGIDFAGDTGSDRLILQRSAGSFVAGLTLHVATGLGAGSVSVDGRVISYTGLEPIDDTVPSTNFTFFAPNTASHLEIVNGPTVNGAATTQINDGGTGAFELVNFAGKANVTINTGMVAQTLVINNSATPPGLSTLNVNASSADDDINVIAVPGGITAMVNGLDSSDSVRVSGAGVPIGTTLFLDNGAGFDRLVYDTGGVGINRNAGPGADQTTITRPGSGNVIYQNFEDVTFDGIARALNISTRLRVLTGDNALIGGFIITGGANKKVIMRAIGPSLSQFGLLGVLADPTLELYDSNSQLAAMNDNWRETQETEITATGVAPQNDLESALVTTLLPGNHTVVVRGKDNASGIGVVEAYDLEAQTPAQFANISTRGFVDAGDKVMIGGFILGGDNGSTHVAIRGIGPSLAQAGLSNVLVDPTLDLYDGNGTRLIFNDNWMDDSSQAAALTAVGLAPSTNEESAIFTTLSPGAFTAILAGKDGGIGVGLVEVYNLQ
jgi:hypothetical protein